MYDINLKVVKSGRTLWYIFLAFGLLFLLIMGGIVANMFYVESQIDQEVMSTDMRVEVGEDDEGYTEYYPIYSFDVNGTQFECEGDTKSSYPTSDPAKIYFSGQDPETCLVGSPKYEDKWFIAIFLVLPITFILLSVSGLISISKRVRKVKALNETGKLVKGLPYRMVPTGTSVNNVPILKPVIDYELPDGKKIELHGDSRFDKKHSDEDGLVDLVIDEMNPDNYFIDFEINRIDGNRSSDYYTNPNSPTQPKDPYETSYGTYGTFK